MTSTYYFALMLLNLNYDNLPNADTFSQFLLVSIILLTILVNLCVFFIKIGRKLVLLRKRWLEYLKSRVQKYGSCEELVPNSCEAEGETIKMMKTRKMDIEEEKDKNFTDLFSIDHKF
jgi:hypothetical protein